MQVTSHIEHDIPQGHEYAWARLVDHLRSIDVEITLKCGELLVRERLGELNYRELLRVDLRKPAPAGACGCQSCQTKKKKENENVDL